MDQTEIKQMLEQLGAKAKSASRKLATASTEEKNQWLAAMADAIDASEAESRSLLCNAGSFEARSRKN